MDKYKRIRQILEVMTALCIIATGIYVAIMWKTVPDVIPIHYGVNGEADAYGSKIHLWILYGIMILMYGVMFLCQGNPDSWNLPMLTKEQKKKSADLLKTTMVAIKLEVVGILAFLLIQTSRGALLGKWVIWIVLLMILVTIGAGIYKCKKS